MKKQAIFSQFSIFLSVFVFFSMLFPVFAQAQGTPDGQPPAVTCDSYVVMDSATGQILAEKEQDTRINPASVTKMMTALLVLESGEDLSKTVTCASTVTSFDKDSSLVGLEDGEQVTYTDLLYGLLLVSGNDAAAALAYQLGDGNIQTFVDKMNERAREIGMNKTHFANPHGLTNEEHYSTAYDMALLARECMKNETFRTIVGSPEHTMAATNRHGERKIRTTNKLISTRDTDQTYHYDAATGIKTGSTTAAGGCLASAAKVNDREIIAVLFGDRSQTKEAKYYKRWTESKQLLEYGFTISVLDVTQKIKDTQLATVLPGDTDPSVLTPLIQDDTIYFNATQDIAAAYQAEGFQFDVSYELDPNLATPVADGAMVGEAVYSIQGVEVFRTQITKKPVEVVQSPVDSDAFRPVIIILLCVGLFFMLVMCLRIVTRPRRRRQLRNSRRMYNSDSKRARQAAKNNRNRNQRKQLRAPSEYEYMNRRRR